MFKTRLKTTSSTMDHSPPSSQPKSQTKLPRELPLATQLAPPPMPRKLLYEFQSNSGLNAGLNVVDANASANVEEARNVWGSEEDENELSFRRPETFAVQLTARTSNILKKANGSSSKLGTWPSLGTSLGGTMPLFRSSLLTTPLSVPSNMK